MPPMPTPRRRARTAVAAVLLAAAAGDAAGAAHHYRYLSNFDIKGNDISHSPVPLDQCPGACDAEPACRAWVHAKDNCWLKASRAARDLKALPKTRRGAVMAGLAALDHPEKSIEADPAELRAHQAATQAILDGALGKIVQHGVVPVTRGGEPRLGGVMWYELEETVEDCALLCHGREGCTAFVFLEPDFCYIAAATEADVARSGAGAATQAAATPKLRGMGQWKLGSSGVIVDPPRHPRNTAPAAHFFPQWVAPEDSGGAAANAAANADAATDDDAGVASAVATAADDVASAAAAACVASGGKECYCVHPTWDLGRVSAADTCAALRGQTMLLTGSSILRDMWNALGLWLLQEDGVRLMTGCAAHLHAACFLNADKTLKWLGAQKQVAAAGFFASAGRGVQEYRLCGGQFRLQYLSASTFKKMRAKIPAVLATGDVDVWVAGGGLHDMALVPSEEDPAAVTEWAADLVSWAKGARAPRQSVFVSLHRRIVEKVPSRYRHLAEGPLQGNPRIRAWNAVGLKAFRDAGLGAIDMYNVTAPLAADVDGSEDGMHFGVLANHEKLQRILAHVVAGAAAREQAKGEL